MWMPGRAQCARAAHRIVVGVVIAGLVLLVCAGLGALPASRF